jgi:membrane protein required for colicin V production
MVLDIIFVAIFCWAGYKGYSRGFILQAAMLAALILGIYGAIKFSGFTANFISKQFSFNGDYLHIIAFAVTFIGIVIGIHFLARISEKLLQAISLNFINRLLGILFNTVKYAFIISAILVVINGINRRTHFLPQDKLNESKLYRPLSMLAPLLFPYLHFDVITPDDKPESVLEELIV